MNKKMLHLIIDCLEMSDENINTHIVTDLFSGEVVSIKPDIYSKKMAKRLYRAKDCFLRVQSRRNDMLEAIYKTDLKKEKRDRDYMSLTHFIMTFKDCIYTKEQMVDLLSRFEEVKNPSRKAYSFKELHSIKYITQEDVDNFVEEITK